MAKKKEVRTPEITPVEISQPEGCATETLEFTVVREGVPTYTIHADTGFGMLGMLALHRLAQDWGGPAELRREVEGVMREFEFWEEDHRGDPAA